MSAPIPTIEPTTFAVGETVQWNMTVADYPNTDGWSLIYSIRGPAAFSDVTATNNADGSYSVVIAAATTANLIAGTYQWASHAYIASPLQRFPVNRGTIVVTQSLVAITGTLTTHVSRTLALIEAAIEGRVPVDMQQYQIAGRQITKIPVLELYGLRARYRAELAQERNPTRANPVRSITFVNT